MIGVRHAVARDVPGFVPAQIVFVHEQAHQFRHRDGGMRIVKLEAVFRGELAEILAVDAHPLSEHVLETSGSEEVLLA